MRMTSIALSNIKRRKKSTFVILFILVIAQITFIGAFTYAGSTSTFLDKYIFQATGYRTIGVDTMISDEGVETRLRQIVDNESRIRDFYHQSYGMVGYLLDSSLPNLADKYKSDDSVGVVILNAYKNSYEDIIVDGRRIHDGEKKVGLIPSNYLPVDSFEIDFWNQGDEFIDGKDLIGQTITLNYRAYDFSKSPFEIIGNYEYSFQVIGTYDALTELYEPNEIIIPYSDLLEIQNLVSDNNLGLSEDFNKTYTIEVDDRKNVNDIYNVLIENGFNPYIVNTVGPIAETSQMVLSIGTIIAIVIFGLSALLIAASIYKSVHDRKKELGMMRVVGYSKGRLVKIIVIETLIIGISSMLVTAVILIIGINVTNIYISTNASLFSQRFRLSVPIKPLLTDFSLGLIIPLFAGLYSSKEILQVEPLDALYVRKG